MTEKERRELLAEQAREARRSYGTNDDPPWYASPAGVILVAALIFIAVSVG